MPRMHAWQGIGSLLHCLAWPQMRMSVARLLVLLRGVLAVCAESHGFVIEVVDRNGREVVFAFSPWAAILANGRTANWPGPSCKSQGRPRRCPSSGGDPVDEDCGDHP